jgi:transposase-like protein
MSTNQHLYQLCDNLLINNSNIYVDYRYHRFALSFRNIEELLASRGIAVGNETMVLMLVSKRSHFAAIP